MSNAEIEAGVAYIEQRVRELVASLGLLAPFLVWGSKALTLSPGADSRPAGPTLYPLRIRIGAHDEIIRNSLGLEVRQVIDYQL